MPFLLAEKNPDGQTPFVYAIQHRRYDIAIQLMHCAHAIQHSSGINSDDILFNSVSNFDMSSKVKKVDFECDAEVKQRTIKKLLFNQPCSSVWPFRNKNLPQNNYECLTCCTALRQVICSNCALSCHAGHELVVKSSPFSGQCFCSLNTHCCAIHDGGSLLRRDLIKLITMKDPAFIAKTRACSHYLRFLFANEYLKKLPYSDPLSLKPEASSSRIHSKNKDGHFSQHIKLVEKTLEFLFDYDECIVSCFDLNLPLPKYAKSLRSMCTSAYIDLHDTANAPMTIEEFIFLALNIRSNMFIESLLKAIDQIPFSTSEEKNNIESRLIEATCEIFVSYKYQSMKQSDTTMQEHFQSFFPKCYRIFSQYPVKFMAQLQKHACTLSTAIITNTKVKLPTKNDGATYLAMFLNNNWAIHCFDLSNSSSNTSLFVNDQSKESVNFESDANEDLASASTANLVGSVSTIGQVQPLVPLQSQSLSAASVQSTPLEFRMDANNHSEARTELTSFSNIPSRFNMPANSAVGSFHISDELSNRTTLIHPIPHMSTEIQSDSSEDDELAHIAAGQVTFSPFLSQHEIPTQITTRQPDQPTHMRWLPFNTARARRFLDNHAINNLLNGEEPFGRERPGQFSSYDDDSLGDISQSAEFTLYERLIDHTLFPSSSRADFKVKSGKHTMLKMAQFYSVIVTELCNMFMAVNIQPLIKPSADENKINYNNEPVPFAADQIKFNKMRSELSTLLCPMKEWLVTKLDMFEKKLYEIEKQRENRKKERDALSTQDPEINANRTQTLDEIERITNTYEDLSSLHRIITLLRNNPQNDPKDFFIDEKLSQILAVIANCMMFYYDTLDFLYFCSKDTSNYVLNRFFKFEQDLMPGYIENKSLALPLDLKIPLAMQPTMMDLNRKQDILGLKPFEFISTLENIKTALLSADAGKLISRVYERSLSYVTNGCTNDVSISLSKKFRYHYQNLSVKLRNMRTMLNSVLSRSKPVEIKIETAREERKIIDNTYSALCKFIKSNYKKRDNSREHNTVDKFKNLLPYFALTVTFEDELAEGTGVVRSYFGEISKTVLNSNKLPVLSCQNSTDIEKLFDNSIDPESIERFYDGESQFSITDYYGYDGPADDKWENRRSLIAKFACMNSCNTYSNVKYAYQSEAVSSPAAMLEFIRDVDNFVKKSAKEQESEGLFFMINEWIRDPSTCKLKPTEFHEHFSLFWEPSIKGLYSPRPGDYSPQRCLYFLLVGCLLGMAIRMREVTYFSFCRHVRKYLLGQPMEWHDMAFYDNVIYNTMSKLMQMHEQNDAEGIENLGLHFDCYLDENEGTGYIELIKNGSKVPVTINNIKRYIYLYCHTKMIVLAEPALYHMKKGLELFVPGELLDAFSAEDLHHILVGHQTIKPAQIWRLVDFKDESQLPKEEVTNFKGWFKSIVFNMEPKSLHALLNFWTSIPTLKFEKGPKLTACIRPPTDESLPTSNTCVNRLHLPVYSSKEILQSKLMLAIKTEHFGFI